MRFIGNILWLLFGGLEMALAWAVLGLLWCVTILGIPIGVQCFKIAGLYLSPMGKEVRTGGGTMSTLANILWLLFGGLELAIADILWGLFLCVTIIGIPFGKQHFKLAKLSLTPFGATVE